MTAVYPGSFDPVTKGHIDLIRRARAIFPRVVVGVAMDPGKETLFTAEERVAMLRQAVGRRPGVRVEAFEGLAVSFARSHRALAIIRGLRMLSDFEYEFQMALTNRRLDPEIETVFLMPSPEYSYLSSRLIKEAARLGADVGEFVPAFVRKRLSEKLTRDPAPPVPALSNSAGSSRARVRQRSRRRRGGYGPVGP